MRKLSASYNDGVLTLQPQEYIEDGWYIEQRGLMWRVLEIPQYGGEAQFIKSFNTCGEALACALNLT